MKIKCYRVSLFFLVVIFIISGCSKSPQVRPDQMKGKTKVAVSSASTLTDNYKALKKTMQKKAKDREMEVVWLDAQGSAFKQEEDIDKASEEKAKVIVIEPVDAEIIRSKVTAVQQKDVKIICIANLPPDTAVDAFIAPDFLRAGEMQGQQLLKNVAENETVNILILRGAKGNSAAEDILKGNFNVLNGNKKTGQVWIEEIENRDSSTSYDRVKEYLTGEKVPAAILAHSPEITIGMLEALEQHRPAGKVMSFGIGAEKEAVEAINKGTHTAEVDLMPELLAQIIMQAANSLSKDEPWEYEQLLPNGTHNAPARFTPIRSITQENVALLQERMAALEQGDNEGGQQGEENKNNKDNPGKEESKNENNNPDQEKKKKTVVKIKTKDGQEFEMNISGEIESIEMKGEDAKEGEGKEQGEEQG